MIEKNKMKISKKLITLCLLFVSLSYSEFNFNLNSGISLTNIQQTFPDIAIDDNGIIHVVWVEQSGNSKNIYYNNSEDNGITFSDKIQINSVNGHVVAYGGAGPRIRAIEGNIYIIWADSRNGYNNTSIYLNQSIDNGISWVDEIELSISSIGYPVALKGCSNINSLELKSLSNPFLSFKLSMKLFK